jgi:hypothetical protein
MPGAVEIDASNVRARILARAVHIAGNYAEFEDILKHVDEFKVIVEVDVQ